MNPAVDILVKKLGGLAPRLAMVLGSGLGGLTQELERPVHVPFSELPGFPAGGVSGHAKEVVTGYLAGVPVVMIAGRVHYYEEGNAGAMRPVIEALSSVGITHLLLTNAAGSVRQDMPPGSVMIIEDHINFSGSNPLFGEPTAACGRRWKLRRGRRGFRFRRAFICGSLARVLRHPPKSAWRG
jgi:purine-nucleoside phosphorylase